MRAVYMTGHGGNEVVQIGEWPTPQRSSGDVLVRFHAAGLNRVDLYVRESGAGITHTLPQIRGVDGAGTIAEIDHDESRLSLGQSVVLHTGVGCGRCEFCRRSEHVLCTTVQFLGEHRDGTLAEFVWVPVENAFTVPKGLDFIEAAALGDAYPTSWRMLFTTAKIRPWETVLIFGIGGSVSLAALQLAKMIGARAIVTSRDPAKLARVTELGADSTIEADSKI